MECIKVGQKERNIEAKLQDDRAVMFAFLSIFRDTPEILGKAGYQECLEKENSNATNHNNIQYKRANCF